MKAQEFRDMTIEELRAKEKEVQEALFNLKFQHATGLLENPMRLPMTKKDLARIKTILRAKALTEKKTKGV